MDCLTSGNVYPSYPENVRAFCLKLHFYSPRAYEFVRSEFGNHLPHISTIRKWYTNSNLDAEEGLSLKALDILEQMANTMKRTNQKLICCLSFDEMKIKQHVQWCGKTNRFYGPVTYDNNKSDDPASDVIVFFFEWCECSNTSCYRLLFHKES